MPRRAKGRQRPPRSDCGVTSQGLVSSPREHSAIQRPYSDVRVDVFGELGSAAQLQLLNMQFSLAEKPSAEATRKESTAAVPAGATTTYSQ